VKRYGNYGRKVSWNVKILKIWKKRKLKSEKILSLFNLPFFHIFHIVSLFNLLFFHIFHIFSLFNLLFFRIVHKIYGNYGRKVSWIVKR
jgi:hypothetical protein